MNTKIILKIIEYFQNNRHKRPPQLFIFFLSLAVHYDDGTQSCTESIDSLADFSGISRRTIQRLKKFAENEDLIRSSKIKNMYTQSIQFTDKVLT